MNDAIALKVRKEEHIIRRYETNHVVHFLISVLSFGLWLPVWLLVELSNGAERRKAERRIDKIYEEYLK